MLHQLPSLKRLHTPGVPGPLPSADIRGGGGLEEPKLENVPFKLGGWGGEMGPEADFKAVAEKVESDTGLRALYQIVVPCMSGRVSAVNSRS